MKHILCFLFLLPVAAAGQTSAATPKHISAYEAEERLMYEILALYETDSNTSREAQNFCKHFKRYGKAERQERFLEWTHSTHRLQSQAEQLESTLILMGHSIDSYPLGESLRLKQILTEITDMDIFNATPASNYQNCVESKLISESGISSSAVVATLHKQLLTTQSLIMSRLISAESMLKIYTSAITLAKLDIESKRTGIPSDLSLESSITAIMSSQPHSMPLGFRKSTAAIKDYIKRLLTARSLKTEPTK